MKVVKERLPGTADGIFVTVAFLLSLITLVHLLECVSASGCSWEL